MGRRAATLVAALLGLTLLAGCGGGAGAAQHTWRDVPGGVQAPAASLTDTSGSSYSLAGSTTKPLTLVFFGYTHCPDICGLVMGNLASAMTRLSEADRAKVDVVFVTTDPARDDQGVLRRYLDHYDPSFIGLTGPLARIVRIAKVFGTGLSRGPRLPSGGYDVTHGSYVFAVDGKHGVPYYWREETSPAQYAADVHDLLSGDAGGSDH